MERNKTLDQFFELKCKQMLLKLWLMAFAKPGYVSDELGLLERHMEVEAKRESVDDELMKFLTEHKKEFEEDFTMEDLNNYCQEYKVSIERQKEISKELLGKEYSIEELIEKIERRG